MDAWTMENGTLRAGIDCGVDGKIYVGEPRGHLVSVVPPEGAVVVKVMGPKLLAVVATSGDYAGVGALVLLRDRSTRWAGGWELRLPSWDKPRGRASLGAVGATILAEGCLAEPAVVEYLVVLRPLTHLVIERRGVPLALRVAATGEVSLGPAATETPAPARCVGPYPGRWCPGAMIAPSEGEARGAGLVFFRRDPAHAGGAWRCKRCTATLAQMRELSAHAAANVGVGVEPWGGCDRKVKS